MSTAAIVSARPVVARIEHSRLVAAAPDSLPAPANAIAGKFTIAAAANGAVTLMGPHGESCGIFPNEQMAQATADHLNRS